MVKLLSLLTLLLASGSLGVQAAELEAIPDRLQISVEESLNLELRASGSVDGSPDLSVLEKDFELLGRSEASQIQVVNGEISRTTSWHLSLLPRSAGTKQIPPLCVGSACSAPLTIEVLPAGEGPQGAAGGEDLLLEVSAEPNRLYVQSQLIYRVRLLTRLDILQASLSEPQATGVETVVQKLGEDRQFETRRNGIRYRAIERSYAIFPQQSGRLTLEPLRFDAQVRVGQRGQFPFNQRSRQVRKHSQELSFEVLPAVDPAGRTWLPAETLQVQDDWQQQPPQLTVGEPATRTLSLQARGLPAAQLPVFDLVIPDGFKSYSDQPNRQDQLAESGITGRLEQKLALVPTRPGRIQLPAILIDWYDLQNDSWRQARLPEIELEVLPATGQPQPPAPAPAAPTEPVASSPVARPAAPPIPVNKGFWPWLSLALACGWLLTLRALWRNQRRHKATAANAPQADPDLKSARRALQQALQRNEPAQVRAALLSWGAALYPVAPPRNLEELARLGDESLAEQLADFSRSCYGRNREDWDQHQLLKAIEQAERDTEKGADQGLPAFYPPQRTGRT